jgi:hypothetical protein
VNTHRSDNASIQLGDAARRLSAAAAGVAGVGLLLTVALYFATPAPRFFRAYIAAFMVVIGISVAALLFTQIFHAVRAGWVISLRRLMEVLASNLQWLWLLFLPVAAGMLWSNSTHLYEWNVDQAVAHDHLLQGKAGYLNAGFWLLRAALFFATWILLARFFLGNSVAQDRTGDLEHTHRMQRLAPVGILLTALTIHFAAVDWMMSLEPHWFSTIFGVYTFAASCAAFFSFMILLVYALQRMGKLEREITPEHWQELGKGLFAFGVVFWAYIGFSQFMLIWYGNIPEETAWFMVRGQGGWWAVSLLLVFGHFLIPFLAIMSRHPKRRKPVLAAAATWMLFMAFVDFYWVVVPQTPSELLAGTQQGLEGHQEFVRSYREGLVSAEALHHMGYHGDETLTYDAVYGFHPRLVDVTTLLGILGLYGAVTLRRLGRQSLLPQRDPRLHEGLAFENA